MGEAASWAGALSLPMLMKPYSASNSGVASPRASSLRQHRGMANVLGSFRHLVGKRMTLRNNLRSLHVKVVGFTSRKVFIYLQCYFVTIATILGTGVLGLPVTLSQSGLWPFVVSFVIGFLMQGLLIVFMADLLQKAVHIQSSAPTYSALEQEGFVTASFSAVTAASSSGSGSGSSSSDEKGEYTDLDADSPGVAIEDADDDGEVAKAQVVSRAKSPAATPRHEQAAATAAASRVHPDLHLLAELFLPRGLRELFDVLLLFQFMAVLISYCLAGSEAFAELLKVNVLYAIPVFCWVLSLVVVFAMKIVQPFVSFLTFCKGTMLLVTVVLTFVVGSTVHREIHTDFAYTGSSFLMGTVALGGVANVMPYLYEKIATSASQVRRFRWACFLGLATCTVLNIAWCWAVLDIVPQTDADAMAGCSAGGNTSTWSASCTTNSSISLESARRNGEISTIPLARILERDYPSYNWVALLVQVFIVVSISVSFLVNGTVLYHTLKGLLHAKWPVGRFRCCDHGKRVTTEGVTAALIQLCLFAIVFAVSMANPKSFVQMLDKVASFSMNLEVALFLTVMFWKSFNKDHVALPVPVALPSWLKHVRHALTLYFSVAVVYDVVVSIMEATGSNPM